MAKRETIEHLGVSIGVGAKKKLREYARAERRSLSSYCELLLLNHIEEREGAKRELNK